MPCCCSLNSPKIHIKERSKWVKVIDPETRRVNDDFILLYQLQIANRLITINLAKGYFLLKQKFPDFAKSDTLP